MTGVCNKVAFVYFGTQGACLFTSLPLHMSGGEKTVTSILKDDFCQ